MSAAKKEPKKLFCDQRNPVLTVLMTAEMLMLLLLLLLLSLSHQCGRF
jgi:hypothetical protein